MSPGGAIFVPFPPKTGTNLLHPRSPQSLNGSGGKYFFDDFLRCVARPIREGDNSDELANLANICVASKDTSFTSLSEVSPFLRIGFATQQGKSWKKDFPLRPCIPEVATPPVLTLHAPSSTLTIFP